MAVALEIEDAGPPPPHLVLPVAQQHRWGNNRDIQRKSRAKLDVANKDRGQPFDESLPCDSNEATTLSVCEDDNYGRVHITIAETLSRVIIPLHVDTNIGDPMWADKHPKQNHLRNLHSPTRVCRGKDVYSQTGCGVLSPFREAIGRAAIQASTSSSRQVTEFKPSCTRCGNSRRRSIRYMVILERPVIATTCGKRSSFTSPILQ